MVMFKKNSETMVNYLTANAFCLKNSEHNSDSVLFRSLNA